MDVDARRKNKPIARLLDAAKLDLDAATRLLELHEAARGELLATSA